MTEPDSTMRSAQSWHGEGWPELRSAPPWVMSEMIAAGPGLVAPILANNEATPLAWLIVDAVDRGEAVVVTGCGTSEHGALAVTALLDQALRLSGRRGGSVECRQAFDAALDPRPRGFCLALSHDGSTPATRQALEAAVATGAHTGLITFQLAGSIAPLADAVFVTPEHDESWCHTLAYVSMILAGAAIGAAIAGVTLDATSLVDYLTAALGNEPAATEIAASLVAANHRLAIGSGVDFGTARELALKIEEGPRLPCTARDLETLLHGHLVARDPTTGITFLGIDQGGGDRFVRRLAVAMRAVAELGMQPAAVLAPESASAIALELTPGGRLVLPAAPECALPRLPVLLGGAAALQIITLAMVEQVGVNPDLIRREEAPYRNAAAIIESESSW